MPESNGFGPRCDDDIVFRDGDTFTAAELDQIATHARRVRDVASDLVAACRLYSGLSRVESGSGPIHAAVASRIAELSGTLTLTAGPLSDCH